MSTPERPPLTDAELAEARRLCDNTAAFVMMRRDTSVRLLDEVARLRQEKTCATCQHWDGDEFVSKYSVCRAPMLRKHVALATLFETRCDFGCNLWQVRDRLAGTAGGEQ